MVQRLLCTWTDLAAQPDEGCLQKRRQSPGDVDLARPHSSLGKKPGQLLGTGEEQMSKLTMTTFVTLDGVMQAPGGPQEDTRDGFQHGGWLVPCFDPDAGKFMSGVFERADAFLLGRVTYQIFAGHWPRVTDASNVVATKLNALPKHVASSTLEKTAWSNSCLVRDVVTEVAQLKARYQRELQVHGSGGLAQTLIEHDLVDEYNLLTFPVMLGTGRRLFGAGTMPAALELAGSQVTSTGVVISTYQRAGRPKYGSFMLD
jgi:dihydrofolate reductase